MFRPSFFARPWIRRGLLGLVLVGIPLLWKLFLLQGPPLANQGAAAAPALFRFHAKGLLLAELGYPRDLEALLPAPQTGSSPSVQLQLMGWWDGRVWTQKALGQGRTSGRDLRVRLGRLVLGEVREVTPVREANGTKLCGVSYQARWELPDAEAELLRLQPLVGLRLTAGQPVRMPGQEIPEKVTLERTSWGWKVQDANQVRGHSRGTAGSVWPWLRWLM